MNTIYIYLAARDGAPVRYRWRIEFDNRDREILALQSNLQNGRITIRAFLMAAAHHFDPVELEFGDQDIEVMNRPLNELRAAFEALLNNPVAVPVATEAPVPVNTEVAVPVAAEAAIPVTVVAAEAVNPAAIVAVENPPVVPAIIGQGPGRATFE
jgi:hypothetical protein